MNRRQFIVTSSLALAGCRSRSGTRRDFPQEVSAQMHGELNRARDVINQVGVHKISPKSVTATLIPGQRWQGGAWTWLVAYPGFPNGLWVMGLCYGPRIEVGRNPNAVDPQVHWSTVHHEFVHHWLMQNGHGPNHFPEYDRYVDGWAHARRVVGNSFTISQDQQISEEYLLQQFGAGQLDITLEVDGKPVALDVWVPEEGTEILSRPTPHQLIWKL